MRELHRLAVDLDGAAVRLDRTGECCEQLVLALPFERDDAGDLAVLQVEGDVLQLGADLEVADRDARAARGRRRSFVRLALRHALLLDLGAEHQLDDALLDAGDDIDHADRLAVAQTRLPGCRLRRSR